MGLFSKLFKGPQIDHGKDARKCKKMRQLFNHAVPDGETYRLIFGYTERCNAGSISALFTEAKQKSEICL